MKFVLNTTYGGFSVPEEIAPMVCEPERNDDGSLQMYNGKPWYNRWACDRQNATLIALVEAGKLGDSLEVVEIPNTTTDWEIRNYDGCETLIYVVDGKIHHA